MWILEAKFFFSLSNIDMHLAGGGVSCSSCFSFLFFRIVVADCVRVSEFDHGFVYVFACLDAKKMK